MSLSWKPSEGFHTFPRTGSGRQSPPSPTRGRALRVHDFLDLRLASARFARGAPTHVPSGALPAARAPSLASAQSKTLARDGIACLLCGFQQDAETRARAIRLCLTLA